MIRFALDVRQVFGKILVRAVLNSRGTDVIKPTKLIIKDRRKWYLEGDFRVATWDGLGEEVDVVGAGRHGDAHEPPLRPQLGEEVEVEVLPPRPLRRLLPPARWLVDQPVLHLLLPVRRTQLPPLSTLRSLFPPRQLAPCIRGSRSR